MAPLADQDRVTVVEIGDDEGGVWIAEHRVDGLGAVWKTDHILPQCKWPGAPGDRSADDLERPAVLGMLEVGYLLTTAATAAAAAAMCRGSGP